ncbi:caspase, EACC1-associated type [Allorhizocola rhizosphaerae]|uniref:caspase, EACC1-associated type n=1 Tax=Allorhizocola rhizosphaerae TaxID=1872709 RepID=UPI0013C2CD2B|nr:caspase family protein [Allorhizocola rhizosphaerae]
MSSRKALMLACGTYKDPSLPPLRAASNDTRSLADTLTRLPGVPYDVTAQIDCTSAQAQQAIETFFANTRSTDLHLLYLSCHGIQNANGELHFAFADTQPHLLASTSLSAEFVRMRIQASRSRRTVVLIDCCFSGSFLRTMQARGHDQVNVNTLVRDIPEGNGLAVLTASGDTEYSFEDLRERGDGFRSYFTNGVIRGIATGAADHDGDGQITIDELYDFVYQHVLESPSPQRPRKLRTGEGRIVIAETPISYVESTPPPPPPPAPRAHQAPSILPLTAKGALGTVSFDGEWVYVAMNGWGPKANGTESIHIGEIIRIDFKPGTTFYHGYIQFIRRGKMPAPIQQHGPHKGRPHMYDPDSVSVPKKANQAFIHLREVISAACGLPPPSPKADTKPPPQVLATVQPHHSPTPSPTAAKQHPPGRARFIWTVIGRTLLWMLISFLALGTIITGGTTIAGKWEQSLGNPIGAILCYGIPLTALLSLGIWDIRRQKRRALRVPAGQANP